MNPLNFYRKSPVQKEWEALCIKEKRFLERRQKKQEPALNRLLAEKIPQKLQCTLDAAFEKAFSLIFEKGTGVIEKTYHKESAENNFRINLYADQIQNTRKSLKAFAKKADHTGNINLALSGATGIGMGLLGIGIPDIPIFTGMILKCVYETALNYGFGYDSEEERYFVLLILEGAASYGEHLNTVEQKINDFLHHPCCPKNYNSAEQISSASSALSREMLYMKFLQGIPVVGAVGGAYDMVYMKQVASYAKLKYKKRFLLQYKKAADPNERQIVF